MDVTDSIDFQANSCSLFFHATPDFLIILKVVVYQAPENIPWLHYGFPSVWNGGHLTQLWPNDHSGESTTVLWETIFLLDEESPLREALFDSTFSLLAWDVVGKVQVNLSLLGGFCHHLFKWASYLIVSYSEMFICTSGCLILVLEAALNSSMVWALWKYSNYYPHQLTILQGTLSRQFCIRLYNFLSVYSLIMDW